MGVSLKNVLKLSSVDEDAAVPSAPTAKPASKDIYLPPERKPPVVKRRPVGRAVSRRR